jgi:hypothetical protein
MLFLRWRAVADRAACGGIIGAAHTLLSTMHAPAKSLLNLDSVSRRTLNDWRTLVYIRAVSVPNETNKEQIAGIAACGEQIKTNSAKYLWICRGVNPPPLPDRPVVNDPNVDPEQLRMRPRLLHRAGPRARQRP